MPLALLQPGGEYCFEPLICTPKTLIMLSSLPASPQLPGHPQWTVACVLWQRGRLWQCCWRVLAAKGSRGAKHWFGATVFFNRGNGRQELRCWCRRCQESLHELLLQQCRRGFLAVASAGCIKRDSFEASPSEAAAATSLMKVRVS